MFTKFNITNYVLGAIVLILVLLGFVLNQNYKQNQVCATIEIRLKNINQGHLITKLTVESLLTKQGKEPLVGYKFNLLNLQELEKRVLKNRLISSCQISRSVGSTLLVEVQEAEPIARLMPSWQNGNLFEGYYLDSFGRIFPLSNHYTKKVLLLSGSYLIGKKHLKAKSDKNLLAFLNHIYKEPYWRSNIAHVLVGPQQEIQLQCVIGNAIIEFGQAKPTEIENKLDKIKLYYQYILPQGDQKYTNVSVKYLGQIVAKKAPLKAAIDSTLAN
jgi:cell division protein FtsQ